jgi:hypothetical protein
MVPTLGSFSVCRERELRKEKLCRDMADGYRIAMESRNTGTKKIRLFVLQEDTPMKQYMTTIFYVFLSGVQCMHEVFY